MMRFTSVNKVNIIQIFCFSQGLATFVGYIADPKIGITIAISIATHNIPEGQSIFNSSKLLPYLLLLRWIMHVD